MVILGDLLDIIWDVTELDIRAYDNGRLQHEWIIGENVEETYHQWHSRKKGELSIIDRKINRHGDIIRKNGLSEMGWGVNKANIPPVMLAAEVTHMLLSNRLRKNPWDEPGQELYVSVNMDALTVLTLKAELAAVERPLETEGDDCDDEARIPEDPD